MVFCFVMSNFMKKQVARLVGLTTSLFHKIATSLTEHVRIYSHKDARPMDVSCCSNSLVFLLVFDKNFEEKL